MKHYYIDVGEKERAKEWLGFHSVPFCLAVSCDGTICESGGTGQFDLAQALLQLEHSAFLHLEHCYSRFQKENQGQSSNRAETRHNPGTSDQKDHQAIQLERIFDINHEF